MEDYFYNKIFIRVESVICMCTKHFTKIDVHPQELYYGITKIPTHISVARCISLNILHNYYGMSYKTLSDRSNMTDKSVMKCVAKAREYIHTDKLYQDIYNLAISKLYGKS